MKNRKLFLALIPFVLGILSCTKLDEHYSKTISVSNNQAVSFNIDYIDTQVVSGSGDNIIIEADTSVPFTKRFDLKSYASAGDGSLSVKIDKKTVLSISGYVKIFLPSHLTKVKVYTSSGNLSYSRNIDGSYSLESGPGDIDVKSGSGNFYIHSNSGDIDVKSGVNFTSSSTISTDSGNIDMSLDLSKYSLDLSTKSGDISKPNNGSGNIKLTVSTSSGDIDIN